MRPHIHRHRPAARGFTLIEVLGATFAFLIVFLAGTPAFTRLMVHQTESYHKTVSAVAATFLADRYIRAKERSDSAVTWTGGAGVLDISNVTPAALAFGHGDEVAATDLVATFKPSIADTEFGSDAATATDLDLGGFAGLVVTISARSAADEGIAFRQLSFWHGDPRDVSAIAGGAPGHRPRLDFVGRFLVPDVDP